MDTSTGHLYPTMSAALGAGVQLDDLVFLEGSPEAIERVSQAVAVSVSPEYRAKRKVRIRAAKASRRANRGK